MSEPVVQPTPGNIEASLVRLEGKIDRVIDNQTHQAEEVKIVRERLHEHANILTTFTALNIPEKLTAARERLDQHQADITALRSDFDQRRGALNVMKALWAMIGLIGAGGIAAIVKLIAAH
jgi:flagellar biosynthesis chaperone FliJ